MAKMYEFPIIKSKPMQVIHEDSTETAKKVRKELKKEFPSITFSVKTSKYSGGSSISVSWTDGVREEKVNNITRMFESASFDGMQDLKESKGYAYEGKLYYGADFIFCSRKISAEYRAELEAKAEEYFADFDRGSYEYTRMINEVEKEFFSEDGGNNG